MATHTPEQMHAVADRVFVKRESTLQEEAADHSVDDLKQTVLVVRRMFKTSAQNMTDAAYEAQPDDDEGNEVWSAGEIISHIAGTMIWTDKNIRDLLNMEAAEPDEDFAALAEVKVRGKQEALDIIEASNAKLSEILDIIPSTIETERTIDHQTFGTIGVRGWLLLTALHEADHTRQLRALAADRDS